MSHQEANKYARHLSSPISSQNLGREPGEAKIENPEKVSEISDAKSTHMILNSENLSQLPDLTKKKGAPAEPGTVSIYYTCFCVTLSTTSH